MTKRWYLPESIAACVTAHPPQKTSYRTGAGGRVLPGLVRRRKAEAELYAQAGGVTVPFVGVLVMLAMGLAIAFFREMVL